ncbi:MAG: hypothetical protein JSR46_03255 [Verrucomicrobia bacterium]|nr:hypothetical protein [Verrucomicrobiota bacterium]
MAFLVRLFLSVLIVGTALYSYVDKHNRLTEMRIRLPLLAKELQAIEEENVRLAFCVEQFENPLHLMEIARKPQYAHLKHPLTTDIITIELSHGSIE